MALDEIPEIVLLEGGDLFEPGNKLFVGKFVVFEPGGKAYLVAQYHSVRHSVVVGSFGEWVHDAHGILPERFEGIFGNPTGGGFLSIDRGCITLSDTSAQFGRYDESKTAPIIQRFRDAKVPGSEIRYR
jgi:hypothetical protein